MGEARDQLSVLVVTDPGLPAALAQDLLGRPGRSAGGSERGHRCWTMDAVCERIEADEQGRIRLARLAEHRPQDAPGTVVIGLTDQPRRDGVTPVLAEAVPSERVGLVCVPSLGVLSVRRHLEALLSSLVFDITVPADCPGGDSSGGFGPYRRIDPDHAGGSVRYVGSGIRSRLRELGGMVRANRPWRLVPSLSGAFAAALGTGGLVLINQTMWKLAGSLGAAHLAGAGLLAVTAMVVWLLVDHRMWERPALGQARVLVRRYNVVTVITLGIGVLSLYAGLFLLGLLAQWILIDGHVLRQATGQAGAWSVRAELTCLAASIATVGGALGIGFESDDAVRTAAYGYRQRERRRHQDEAAARRREDHQ